MILDQTQTSRTRRPIAAGPHAEPAPVDPDRFRAAVRRLAAAVGIVTTDGPAGRHGRTVSAACSVTLDPPTILVCIDRKGALAEAIRENGGFAYNVVGRSGRDAAQLFAGSSSADCDARFASARWSDDGAAPRLADAEAVLTCRLAQCVDVGTHLVVLGTVVEAVQSDAPAAPLLYHDRAYAALDRLAD